MRLLLSGCRPEWCRGRAVAPRPAVNWPTLGVRPARQGHGQRHGDCATRHPTAQPVIIPPTRLRAIIRGCRRCRPTRWELSPPAGRAVRAAPRPAPPPGSVAVGTSDEVPRGLPDRTRRPAAPRGAEPADGTGTGGREPCPRPPPPRRRRHRGRRRPAPARHLRPRRPAAGHRRGHRGRASARPAPDSRGRPRRRRRARLPARHRRPKTMSAPRSCAPTFPR